MNFQEYAKSVVSNSNEAKNHISFLIGNLKPTTKCGEAILALYERFPDEYKDKNLFSPVMLKFFYHFQVVESNVSYYDEFSPKWTSSNIEGIKKNNPQWQWDKTAYKNSLEFSKATYIHAEYNNPNKVFNFLEKNSETLKQIIKKDKNKLIKNFHTQSCWQLLALDYEKFSIFCHKYDFDKIKIIKEEFIDSSKGVESLLFQYNTSHFLALLKDLEDNDFSKIFYKNIFLANKSKYDLEIKFKNNCNVLDCVLTLIVDDKVQQAEILLAKFPLEIKGSFPYYLSTENMPEDILGCLKLCVDSIVKTSKERANYPFEPRRLSFHQNTFQDKFNKFKEYMDTIELQKELDETLTIKTNKTSKRKI